MQIPSSGRSSKASSRTLIWIDRKSGGSSFSSPCSVVAAGWLCWTVEETKVLIVLAIFAGWSGKFFFDGGWNFRSRLSSYFLDFSLLGFPLYWSQNFVYYQFCRSQTDSLTSCTLTVILFWEFFTSWLMCQWKFHSIFVQCLLCSRMAWSVSRCFKLNC